MTRLIGAAAALALAIALAAPGRAADAKDANAVLDKAIQALGGEEKLGKFKALTWTVKGTINFGGGDSEFTLTATAQGIDHLRQEFEGDFGGNKVKGRVILAGDKGWRRFGDMDMEMDKDSVTTEKRNAYLAIVPVTVLPLKDKGFKVEAAGEEKVDGKPAAGVKATGPDGKDFTLYFDKESGLPVKLVAKVIGFMGEEYTQETTYGGYKEMAGIKKATKVTSKRDGEKFIDQEVTEFKALDKVDPKTFAEPK